MRGVVTCLWRAGVRVRCAGVQPIYNHVNGTLDEVEEIKPTPIVIFEVRAPLLSLALSPLSSVPASSVGHAREERLAIASSRLGAARVRVACASLSSQ